MEGCPTPKGWTETHCPKEHPQEEHAYWSGGVMRCRQCDRNNREKQKEAAASGESLSIDTIPLVCGHTVRYQRGRYRKGDPTEPLWCFRHENWFGQGRPVT